jgi:hypothetical protein
VDYSKNIQEEFLMSNTNTLQFFLEMGGVIFLAIAAALAVAFTVYWNLLGKKHTSVSKPLLTMSKQQPVAKKVISHSTPSVVSLGRASYQQ